MKSSLPAATKAEKKRFEEMRRLGCPACAQLGLWVIAGHIHHLLRGNKRLGHSFSIFLCEGHHVGHWSMAQLLCIPKEKRIAISDGRKRFTTVYPDERTLWEQVQQKLKLSAEWPLSKVTHV